MGRSVSSYKRKPFTEEHKRKISEAMKGKLKGKRVGEKHPFWGKKHSETTKQKISIANSGKNHRLWGKHISVSAETRQKLSEAQLKRKEKYGHINSLETRQKMSEAQKGRKHTEETKRKISAALKDRVFSEESKRKMSENNAYYWLDKKHSEETKRKISGEKNHNWCGGKSFEPYSVDWTETLRRSIRERDHYTCQLCGEPQGDRVFNVHHIDYNKKNCNTDNLITLCPKCHTKTNYNRKHWAHYKWDNR